MASTNQDFDLLAGDDVVLDFTLSDVETDTTLSGAQGVRWKLARSVFDDPIISKTTEDGIDVTSDLTFTVTLTASDTVALNGLYYHEASVTDVNGFVTTVTTGYVTASQTFRE